MNLKKICFIMCVNDCRFEQEALKYIQHLNIPDGYTIDAVSIEDADSMAQGYNGAIKASDAKYKVYLHQDVFIIEQDFIQKIIDIFQNPNIGMIGMVGCPKLPKHGVMWYADRVGKIYANTVLESKIWCGDQTEGKCTEVDAVDGLLMATQYDLQWREDKFQAWDFYDVSQSIEFRKAGYKVIVPHQIKPWCIHDEGMNNLEQYYKYRRIFVEEYAEFLKNN